MVPDSMITRDVVIITIIRDVMVDSSVPSMVTDVMDSSVPLMVTDVMDSSVPSMVTDVMDSSVPSMATEEMAVSVIMMVIEDLLIPIDRMPDLDRDLVVTEAASIRMMTDVIITEAALVLNREADPDRRIILFPTVQSRMQRSIETKRNVVSARRRIRRTVRI